MVISPNNERNVELRAVYATPHPAIHAKAVGYIKDIIDGVANFEKESDKATGDLNINIIKANRLVTEIEIWIEKSTYARSEQSQYKNIHLFRLQENWI